MPSTYNIAPAYPRLHRHPLASAMIAVLAAATMVLVVSLLCDQEVGAEGASAPSEAPGSVDASHDLP